MPDSVTHSAGSGSQGTGSHGAGSGSHGGAGPEARPPLTYARAGVDLEAGYEAVRRIGRLAATTYGPQVLAGVGGFGGLFALPAGAYRDPVLVAGADGVGTKLKIAFALDRHETVGVDLVAYCVNDILCHGARPLFFLDYLACGKLDPARVETIVSGIVAGCREAGAALLGGETAEMPGFYPPGEYDLAGFAVGVVERDRVIDGRRVAPGDCLIGLASTGLQASGFSLVRRIVAEAGLDLHAHLPELGRTLGEELLTPTAIYARPVLELLGAVDVHGIANISGGGLPENLPRALGGRRARVRRSAWTPPPIFALLARAGGVPEEEMWRTFNMGVGMVVVVPPPQVEAALGVLARAGLAAWPLGEVVDGEAGVEWA